MGADVVEDLVDGRVLLLFEALEQVIGEEAVAVLRAS
jgi:hypothetical protein